MDGQFSTPEMAFYQDDDVLVTDTRVVLRKKMFSTANISSVSVKTIPPEHRSTLTVFVLSATLMACSLCALSFTLSPPSSARERAGTIITEWTLATGMLLLFGGLLFLVAVGMAIFKRRTYVIVLKSGFDETEALMSKNRAYVQRVVNAIGDAIIRRG